MSLEAALAENTASNTALAEVMAKVVANQERLLAGQEAALAKLDDKAASKPARASAKKDEPKATEQPKPEAQTTTTEVSDDDLRDAGAAWMKGKSEDERKDSVAKMNSMLEHFGLKGTKITGPASKLDADQRKQAKFFIERWAAGLEVNFSADYDFDGDPKQDAGSGEPESDPFA